jgi:hypothetical protein
MRTINSDKRQQVFTAAMKLMHDFGELARSLSALFCPNKIKGTCSVVNNQPIDPTNLNQSVENYRATVSISKMMAIWHEMEGWDLLKNQSSCETDFDYVI